LTAHLDGFNVLTTAFGKGDDLGIDYHALKFLKYCRERQAFGAVATIGRQGLHLPPWRVRDILGLAAMTDYGEYCERLLTEHFGASAVESYDNSDYESATYVRDLNLALTPEKQYDTIIDAGCLEHIYNVSNALKNVSAMAKPGAQILHILPSNGFCGHGFWQFSPELFFSLYSEANGYCDTEVFLADLANERCWYKVKEPRSGKRAELVTAKALHVLVRTRLAKPFSHDAVQQSDYRFAWKKHAVADAQLETGPAKRAPTEKSSPRKTAALLWIGRLFYRKMSALFRRASLTPLNPYLTAVDIRDRKVG